MINPSLPAARTRGRMAAATALLLLLTSCTPASSPGPQPEVAPVQPFAHIHGMSVDSETGEVMLATHDGLFGLGSGTPEKIGPTIDLMGFAAAGNDHYYASGHPAPETGLPEPAGLLRSQDGGETWQEVSQGGISDFHALAVTRSGIIGFDGTLKTTADLETWTTRDAGFAPYHLSGTPTGDVVLATTEAGVHRSTDGGKTWTSPSDRPVLLLTAFATASTVVGIEPNGAVHLSSDAGRTWRATGAVIAQPSALVAAGPDESPHIWVATPTGVERSTDGGTTFSADGK
ncbi:exo-alpha-sialidase [Paeniglutamicibacter sp. ABSL32-1]|uniref:F510_1955 family glycosylhydrolase n=1 Tax=Micrococcaceae TaxID=1268 RepID=UPI001C2CD922|nr:exo-alpha-sialidase [Paeniglutamicibacter quisquiliarum]MBV1778523.1 exo-alpha-sialidase [Paeniglutamicibacter quisquiliarum]